MDEQDDYEALGDGSPLYANLIAGAFAGIMVCVFKNTFLPKKKNKIK